MPRLTHETDTGVVKVTDVMPTADDPRNIVRVVEGVSGRVPMRHEWVVRFSVREDHALGEPPPGPGGTHDNVITAVAGPDMLVLRGDRLPHAHDGKHIDEFDVTAGEKLNFSTTWAPSHLPIRHQLDSDAIVETTREEWQEWADRFGHSRPYREIVVRSPSAHACSRTPRPAASWRRRRPAS